MLTSHLALPPLQYMSDAWEEYVANCALFQFGAVVSLAAAA